MLLSPPHFFLPGCCIKWQSWMSFVWLKAPCNSAWHAVLSKPPRTLASVFFSTLTMSNYFKLKRHHGIIYGFMHSLSLSPLVLFFVGRKLGLSILQMNNIILITKIYFVIFNTPFRPLNKAPRGSCKKIPEMDSVICTVTLWGELPQGQSGYT